MRKETYKVLIAVGMGVAAGLSACEATGITNFIPDSKPKTPNSSEIDPTQTEFAKITSATFESITNNETKKSIIDSLPVNRPQSNGVEDVFSLKVGDKKFNFVMYELTDEEVDNGVTIENSEGIKTVQSVATYTEFEGYDGTKSWVRLIGITSKPENPSVVWFYDPNGFPTEERQIDTSRAVFGYDIGSKDNILYQPLITVPTSIPGYDYTQALPVLMDGEVPGTMNINVMLIKPEISPESLGIPEGAILGEDENGNPIYFVTNPAGETVIVGKMNEKENKWEKADAIKFQLFNTIEEAEASGEVVDTEYVLRGGPGQVAKLNGEPFPENVLTGLNVEVVKPNWIDPYNDQLNFDTNSISLLKENPDQAPHRIAGYFLYNNILNGVEQPGYGYVWQWINPDKSFVYITTITSAEPTSSYVLTPFASFNFTKDISIIAPIFDKIGHDEEINSLMLQWAETDVVPTELQDRALIISYRFK